LGRIEAPVDRSPEISVTRPPFAAIALALGISVGLAGCALSPAAPADPVVTLPMNRGWIDGKPVQYVTTDVSDAQVARDVGANYVPRLADALPGAGAAPGAARSLVERVYAFPGKEQFPVFQSGPSPTGADSADRDYSPLWRMVAVRWVRPAAGRELRSEEAILAAQERGEVTLTVTGVVLNCPIVRGVDGRALRGVR
jgi:hypothetical protein